MKYHHSISSPFAVKDREKFLVWARELGIRVQPVKTAPLNRVCIIPPTDGEWHFMDVPEDVELSQENGFWVWFASALGPHLPDNTVVTIFEAFAAEDDHEKVTWADASVHVISSRGDYVYGDLCYLVQLLLSQEPWPLGSVNLYSSGQHGAFDSFVNLPDPTLKTTKTFKDTPAEGHALLERHQSRFRRSVNGAWLSDGGSTETFEIPLATLNSAAGVDWFNPGRCGYVSVKFDGGYLSVSGANDPIQTNGFGELGEVQLADKKVLVCRPHPTLPNIAPGYYRVIHFTDDIAASFTPLRTPA